MKEVQKYVEEIFSSIVKETVSKNNLGMESVQEFLAMELSAQYVKPELDDDDEKIIFEDMRYNYEFLREYGKHLSKVYNIPQKEIDFKFINFGTMALVYAMKVKDEQFAVFLSYPETEPNALKKEAKNLAKFGANCNRIIPPFSYHKNQNTFFRRELFTMELFPQARAISSKNKKFGFYVPEPSYHFETLNKKATEILQTCMIATLLESFDEKTQSGISKIEVIGGDFIVEKDWDKENPTIKDTLDKLKLIAARDTITCSFQEYIDLIRKEFSVQTKKPETLLPNNDYKLSTCNETPFSKNVIENGINLGLKLREEKRENSNKNTLFFEK